MKKSRVINSFEDLAEVIETETLNKEQLFQVVQNAMGLVLNDEQLSYPPEYLTDKLRKHYYKWIHNAEYECIPLFLELDLRVK